MEALFVSVLAIFVGEIGDKTQLLALLLAARFRQPVPIVLGMVLAILINHVLAALLGQWVASHFAPEILRWALGLSFIAIALWTLKPDQIDTQDHDYNKYGVFLITFASFFLAEVGDKTQIATMVLAARYANLPMVVLGSTLGMLLADVPAIFLGKVAAPNFPFKWVRRAAALIFAVLGCAVLVGLGLGRD